MLALVPRLAIVVLLLACSSRALAQDDAVTPPAEPAAQDDAPFVAPASQPIPAPPPIAWSPPASALGAPTTSVRSARFALVDEWLVFQADAAERSRNFNGWLWMIGGLLAAGIEGGILGVGAATGADIAHFPAILLGETVLLIGVGLIEAAVGLFNLLEPSVAERRLARWQSSTQDDEELARMEGELRDEGMHGMHEAYERIAIGSGLFLCAVVGVVLTATLATDDNARYAGYLGSGVVGVMGAMFAIMPAIGALTGQDTWSQIQHGTRPHASLVPWASPWGGGAALSATF